MPGASLQIMQQIFLLKLKKEIEATEIVGFKIIEHKTCFTEKNLVQVGHVYFIVKTALPMPVSAIYCTALPKGRRKNCVPLRSD